MNAEDFLELLSDAPQEMIADCALLLAEPPKNKTSVLMPRFVSCAAAAACIAAVSGMGFLLRDDGMTQQSSIPEAVMQETAAAAATVTTKQTTVVSAEPAVSGKAETFTQAAEEKVPAETAAEAAWIPAETVPLPADAGKSEPEPQLFTEPEITGDLDLDGRFTHADWLWAELIFSAELDGVADELPLTDAQLRQCDLIADDFRSPLGESEYNAFQRTEKLIYQYDFPADLNVRDYLGQQAYYDSFIQQKEQTNPWEDTRIDWAALGLPAQPTEAEFFSAISWKYVLEHAENRNEMTAGELDELRRSCNRTAADYREMRAALAVLPELTPEHQAYQELKGIIHLYVRSRHDARYGDQAWSWFADTDLEGVPLLTQDVILEKLNAAKEWDFRLYE
ncbi:MAG: hypothetical protein J5722_07370 [Oscillospiraceae bacterium]|nr:hypothetical protein [Oscillospiraceae bacterium]